MLAFIGLGTMGSGMAMNLLKKSGEELIVYGRTDAKFAPFAAAGAMTTTRLEDAAKADCIFLCLPDDGVVESVLFGENESGKSGLFPHLRPGTIVVDFSTIRYEATLRIAERLSKKGVHFLDAPVSGMESRAKDGTLAIMCGGDREVFERAGRYFDCVGTTVHYMGASGSGQLMKLVNQLLFDINAAAIAEVLPFAAKLGLDPGKVAEIVNHGTGRSYASEFFIPRDLAGNFAEGYPLEKAYKDLISAAEISAKEGIPLPVLDAAATTYRMAMLMGFGGESKGAMIKVYEKLLGVEFRAKTSSIISAILNPVVRQLARAEEIVWINPKKISYKEAVEKLALTEADIVDASERLRRFAPLIMKLFPETIERDGIIESDLTEIPAMKELLVGVSDADKSAGADAEAMHGAAAGLGAGRLFLKRDSDLAVAGSVKARGGIYEVLKHSETLALEAGILTGYDDDYTKLMSDEARAFFAERKVQVGSTGNLGLSIGIASAALGYQAVVHMSADAKQWKKDLLRSHGVTVVEYAGDYSKAVEKGRAESENEALSYFVDDENSRDLFLGYAVAAERLAAQLEAQQVVVDGQHPLFVYLPCGVGGAPGGIAFGLKARFGDDVHVFFAEPVQACCMLLGLATGLHNGICVQDIGLSGVTQADGLAVGRASGFVGKIVTPLISGEVTVEDDRLFEYLRGLWRSEGIFVEPSACAGFAGVTAVADACATATAGVSEMREYIVRNGLMDKMNEATHIVWATGGMLVPQEVREEYLG